MILLIPISASDAHQLPTFTKAMLHCGSLHAHQIRIVPTRCVTEFGFSLKEDLAPICDNIVVVPLEIDPEGGWPRACTSHYQKAMTAMWREQCTGPMYWFELDNTPLAPRWLDLIQEEYDREGKGFIGAVANTYRTTPQGVTFQAGRHMVGTGIYPESWYRSPSSWTIIPANEPFDIVSQDEILMDCHDSPLICHRGKTSNYRRDSTGGIICDDKDMPPGVSYNTGPVPSTAVVVHGCKDGSLSRLVCSGGQVVSEPVVKRRGRPPKVVVSGSWEALTQPPSPPSEA